MSQPKLNITEKWERARIRHSHRHPPVKNINRDSSRGNDHRPANRRRLAAVMGSWPFIIVQSFILAIWIG